MFKKKMIISVILGVYLGTSEGAEKEDASPGDRGASQDKPFLNMKITKNGGEWF